MPHALGNAPAMYFDLALGRGQLQDQHVLGHPALVAGHDRRDPQREALLAEQRVAAVAGAVGPDLARLGEVDDVLVVGVARPRHVLPRPAERRADRVHAGHVVAVVAERVERRLTHPGHDPHRDRHVRRVGQLHADVGDRRPDRTHRERDHVHRPAAHRALEQAVQQPAHLRGLAPVVRRAGVRLVGRADVRPVLHARHIAGVRPRKVGVRTLGVRQALERAAVDQHLREPVVLLVGAVAPVDRRPAALVPRPPRPSASVARSSSWPSVRYGTWIAVLLAAFGSRSSLPVTWMCSAKSKRPLRGCRTVVVGLPPPLTSASGALSSRKAASLPEIADTLIAAVPRRAVEAARRPPLRLTPLPPLRVVQAVERRHASRSKPRPGGSSAAGRMPIPLRIPSIGGGRFTRDRPDRGVVVSPGATRGSEQRRR